MHIHIYRTVNKEVSRAWVEKAYVCRCGKRQIRQIQRIIPGYPGSGKRFRHWEKTGEWVKERELWKL